MNLTRVRYFVVVAEELHFGRAADRLHMAQPPLSRQIGILERELGVELFERTTRRVALTGAGRTLLTESRRLLADAEAIERLMAQQAEGHAGDLRLGFVDSASYAVMPRLVRAYREHWPSVRFELHTLSSQAQRTALAAGSIDLGIARKTEGDGLDQTVLLEERLLVAVSSSHRLAGQKTTTLTRLVGESFISFRRDRAPALTAELYRLLDEAGVGHDPIIEADEYITVLGLVAAGEGIAVVPESVCSFRPPNLHYVALRDPEAIVKLSLLSRSGERLNIVRQAIAIAPTVLARDYP